MQRNLPRLLALCLGTAIALGMALILRPLLADHEVLAMSFHDGREELAQLDDYLEKQGAPGASRGPLGHLLLTKPIADRLFGFTAQNLLYDPLAYFRRPPFLNDRRQWGEHPDGQWWLRTNSLGLREDRELSRETPDLRIFVTGDSHTDGVCNNSESFPHRLEAALSASRPKASIEILNAGVGGYSFYNYVGTFERYLEFKMDVFVVAVYGGNDFQNIVGPYMFWHGERRPSWGEAWERLEAAMEIDHTSIAQGFLAYAYFAAHAELEELAVDESVRATRALQLRCDQEGVQLIITYIPSMFEVQWKYGSEVWTRVQAALELDEHQMQVTQRQADRYLEALKEWDIEAVDVRPAFEAAQERLYWARDHHLNLAGHQLVSDVLEPHIEKAWRRALNSEKAAR